MKTKTEKRYYTEGMFFQIRMTSRYMNIVGNKVFEKLKTNISFEEYLILEIISYNEGICPIDLAKMLLRDRSNLGKIVSNLEKYKFLRVKPALKNNRTVKNLFLTENGKKVCNDVYMKFNPYMDKVYAAFSKEEQETISKYLIKCRKVFDDISETQI